MTPWRCRASIRRAERNQALQALRDRRARVCVATDVASRGIDLPNLSLVIHVELPRDAEMLQHRSGRTGRAGKKGTAILIVPYPARRRVDGMLRGARINAEWMPVPTPEDIRRNDRERLLTALMAVPVEIDDEDRELATRLLAERSPEDIAAALVAMHRSKMPGVEELLDNSGPPQRGDRPSNDGPRPGFEDTVWFKMDVGRGQNADPRWLLPLICRRGHVTQVRNRRHPHPAQRNPFRNPARAGLALPGGAAPHRRRGPQPRRRHPHHPRRRPAAAAGQGWSATRWPGRQAQPPGAGAPARPRR